MGWCSSYSSITFGLDGDVVVADIDESGDVQGTVILLHVYDNNINDMEVGNRCGLLNFSNQS